MTVILDRKRKRFLTISHKYLGVVLRAIARRDPIDDRQYVIMCQLLDEAMNYAERAGASVDKEVSWAFIEILSLNKKTKAAPPEAPSNVRAAPPEQTP